MKNSSRIYAGKYPSTKNEYRKKCKEIIKFSFFLLSQYLLILPELSLLHYLNDLYNFWLWISFYSSKSSTLLTSALTVPLKRSNLKVIAIRRIQEYSLWMRKAFMIFGNLFSILLLHPFYVRLIVLLKTTFVVFPITAT